VDRRQRQRNETVTRKRNARSLHENDRTTQERRSSLLPFNYSSTATGVYIDHKVLLSFHEPPHIPMLFHIFLPFPFPTPVLRKERQTPVAHGLHVSESFTLPLHLSRRIPRSKAHSHCCSRNVSRKPKHMPNAKPRSLKLPEQQRNYHESTPSSISRFPTLPPSPPPLHCPSPLRLMPLARATQCSQTNG